MSKSKVIKFSSVEERKISKLLLKISTRFVGT